jgi:hypothetical protein
MNRPISSAEQMLRRSTIPGVSAALDVLRARVVDLVWEANTGVGG